MTTTVIVAAAIGGLVGVMGPWEADWTISRTRKPAAQVIYAFVRADGVLFRGKGAKAAEKTGTGSYKVIFDRSISQCVWVATPIDPGLVATVDSNISDTVLVDTFTAAATEADLAFSLQVAC